MSDLLFGEPGKKIKRYSSITFWVCSAVCLICACFAASVNAILSLVFLIMILITYIFSLFIYGFGELLETSAEIRKTLENIDSKTTLDYEKKKKMDIADALKF